MAIPSLVFIDTCVFESQHFDFESTLVASFVQAARSRGVTLLMPDPTRGEIVRHMEEKSKEALQALDTARRKAPFLKAAKLFPEATLWDTQAVALEHFKSFLGRFEKVELLNYEGVDVARVMTWYEARTAPFSDKKRKEFPDAFAIEILNHYAIEVGQPVAVISHDKDMKFACERYTSLFHWETLAPFTELLLIQEKHEQKIFSLIPDAHDLLVEALKEEAKGFLFLHKDPHFKVLESKLSHVDMRDVHMVGIGDGVCTVVFEAVAEFDHEIGWVDWIEEDEREWRTDTFLEDHLVRGSAKLAIKVDETELEKVLTLTTEKIAFQVVERPDLW